jgi:tetratricopeptide (TPR) repeat protein
MELSDLTRPTTLTQFAQMDAITLFVRRTQAINAEFTLNDSNARSVAEICVRLDGLPLAIELAAARTRLFPEPATLLAHLREPLPLLVGGRRDAPARQQTLRNAIQWSHDLLTSDEQRLFRRLAVFAGGASVEAVEEVCDADHGIDVPSALTDLIEQGLVRSTAGPYAEPRVDLLQMIREFALERLKANDEATLMQQRHAAWCLALAEQADASMQGAARVQWLDQLESEHDNMRAALEWSLDQPDGDFPLRLASEMRPFWQTRGYLREGFQWLERALARGDSATPAIRATALFDMGRLAFDLGDYARAPEWFEASLQLRRELDDKPGIIQSLTNLGLAIVARGQYARARMLHEEAMTLSYDIGDAQGVTTALYRLGSLALEEGDLARARALYLESFEKMPGQEDSLFVANLHFMLGVTARLEGEGMAATESVEKSLAVFRRVGNKMGVANALLELGHAIRLSGNDEQAEQYYAEALVLFREMESRPGMVEGLEGLAGIAAAHGRAERAAILIGAASTWRKILEHPFAPPPDRFAQEALVEYAQNDYEAAFANGQNMALEQAVEVGLAVLTFPDTIPSSK